MEYNFHRELEQVADYVNDRMTSVTEEYSRDFEQAKTPEEIALVRAMLEELKDIHHNMAERIKDYGERLRSGNV